jgi:succinoglycan biosynthesis protein ExoA
MPPNRKEPSDGLDPRLTTVIIPARNEERHISTCLDSVLAQTDPHLEVLVIDGASNDRTAEIVREYEKRDARVRLLDNPAGTTPKSLNVGLTAARGKWLVRVDAHSAVSGDYVARSVRHLTTGKWGAVGGRKDGIGITPQGRAIAAAMGSRFGVGNSVYHYGQEIREVEHVPFGAYPTQLLRELGGWDERLPTNQDFELDHRLRENGHALLFDPHIVIQWHSRQSVIDLWRQYRRYGRGKVDVALLHPKSVALRHLAAPALVASWVLAGTLLARRRRSGALIALPYVAALGLATAATAKKVDSEARPWLPAAFAAMHFGWGIGFWEGLARRAILGRSKARLRAEATTESQARATQSS